MFHRNGNLLYIREKSVHSWRGRKFTLLDQFDGLLNRFAIRKNHNWMVRFPEESVLCFYGCCHWHRFYLTTRLFLTLVAELGWVVPDRNQSFVFYCEECMANARLIASTVGWRDWMPSGRMPWRPKAKWIECQGDWMPSNRMPRQLKAKQTLGQGEWRPSGLNAKANERQVDFYYVLTMFWQFARLIIRLIISL